MILGLLVWRLGSGPFLRALDVVDVPVLLTAVLIGVVTTVLSAWRWVLVARGLGIRLPLREAVGDYYRSLFLNAVLPGGVLGDVHRAVRHGKDVGDVALAVKAVVLERVAGQIVLLFAGGAILAAAPLSGLLPVPHPPAGAPVVGLVVAVVLLLVAVAVAALLLRTVVRGTAYRTVQGRAQEPSAGSMIGRTATRTAGVLRGWAVPVRRGLFSRGSRAGILLASTVVLAGHLAMFVVAAGAAGSTVPVGRLVPLLLLALMAMALPLNVGGWGPREAVTTWAFAAAGLNAAQGLTMAVVYGLLALVASLPGAVVLLARRFGRRGVGRTALGRTALGRTGSGRPVPSRVSAPVPIPAAVQVSRPSRRVA